MKKTKPTIIIMIFILCVVLPFVSVDSAVTHTVEITNPSPSESFSYITTNELFIGYSITSGLTPETEYSYSYAWRIDGVIIDQKGYEQKFSSVGGVLILSDEFDYTEDLSIYSVGGHNVSLYVHIFGVAATDTHTHDWTREGSDSVPEITWNTPAYDMLQHNYTALGTSYQVSIDLDLEIGIIDSLWMWVNDVLVEELFSPVTLGTKTKTVTIDSEIVYEIKVKAQTDSNVNFTTTRHIIGFVNGSSIIATLYSYFYSNRAPEFNPFIIANSLGLDNLTIFIDWEDIITVNQTNTVTSVTCNLTYDQLITISDYYQATGLSMIYDKVQIWDEDYFIDDSGDKYFEFTDESEHIVDSGDYYNSVDSFEEDDMSQQQSERADWYNSAWSHRIPMTITYSASETYATVNHTITSGDPVYARDKANGDDWVVTESDGETVVSHWIEAYNGAGDSILWFNATSLSNGDTDYYLYYGNAGASNSENPSNVFDAWDDFDDGYSDEDGLNAARGWTVLSGSPKIEDIGSTSMVMELEVDDSESINDQISNVFGSVIVNTMVHFDIYWSVTFGGQWYFDSAESATSIMMGRIDNDDGSLKYYAGSYIEFNPVVDITDATWYKHDYLITTSDADLFINNTNHDGALRNTPTVGIDTFVWKTADSDDGDLTVYIDNFFVYTFLAGMSASTGSEEERLEDEDWDIGEHIDWYQESGATGVRNDTMMTMWDPVAGSYCYAYVQDENLQLDEPVQNSAYSWEINISCNDVTHIDDIGFSILADTGYYYKMLITGDGYCVAGVGTSPYSQIGLLAGYTNTDISWTGDWITLNITILPDIRVIYFADDVIIRDSYLDDAWQDVSDANCGLLYLLTNNAAGEVKGNITIDYFKTTDYGDGHEGSEGQSYYEYSDPSVVVYNGSRYVSLPATNDVAAIYSNFGGGNWLDYRDSDSISFKARFKVNTDDSTSYGWTCFSVCAQINVTDDYYYSLMTLGGQDRIYFRLTGHMYGPYSIIDSGDYITGASWDDGDWHTYEIQVVKDCWVAGFFDGGLVLNVTDQMWLDCWDEDDEENMIESFALNNMNGYNSSTIEIDYWSEFNWTYNGWTSSEGWDWTIGSGGATDRLDGSMILWDAVAGSNCYAKFTDGQTYAYTLGYPEVFWEVALTPNETTAHYDYLDFYLRLGSYYFHMALFSNDTLSVGVTDGSATGTWFSLTQASVSFTQNQQYIFRMTVGSSWIAYQYSLGSGFTTVRNSTTDYSSYYGFPNYMVVVVDNAGGQTNGFLLIDYLKSGWDEWIDSDATTAGLTYDTTPSLPASIGQDYYVNFTSTQACRFWATITTERNLTGSVYFVFNDSSATTYDSRGDNSTWTMSSTDWAYIVENTEFTMAIRVGDDIGLYTWLNYTLTRDSVAPIVTLNSPEDRPKSDPYSNLQIIPLDYDIYDLHVDNSSWTNDIKWLIIDDEWFTGEAWWQYPKHAPLIFWEGNHTLTVRAVDEAGNYGSDSATFYYEERLEKPLELTFTSSIDDETIDPEQYLNIYLDGMPISATTTTNLNDFNITVYDKFGILLNSTSFDYASTIDIQVPLRPVLFENNNEIICKYKISYNLFEKSFWIVASGSQTYYLNDTTYNLVAEAGDEYYNETHWYGQTWMQFIVVSGMGVIEVALDLISDDPLHNPLLITLYDTDLDIDVGYIYITWETSWGNTTCRVKDNTTWLGIKKSEPWSIWIFDVDDYGMHNITIFIDNGGNVVFDDGFSFYIAAPDEDPNYYLNIATFVDVDGGLFYVTINTYWGNCTIRVMDNDTWWLGDNTTEGSSVWYFDEDSYGLHNFTIYVYQGNDLWDKIYSSITIVEPAADILSFDYYTVQFDADAGHVYLNYATNWANTTCLVRDNSSALSTATGEGISIWTFITDIGFHNITVHINSSSTEWFIDVFSFTITLPEQIWQEVLFSFISSYDSQVIDPNEYLQIFLNDALISAGTSTYLSVFNISIYNNFNQLLYNYTNYPYAATIAIQLPLRNVTFYNPNTISCEYQIWRGTEYVQIWISPLTYSNYYLYDSNYTVLCNPSDIDAGNGYEYISTALSFEVEVGMGNVEVTLDTQQVVIIYRPITIRTTSLYTSGAINERYLRYYLNGTLSLEGATTSTCLLIIRLAVTDVFGNVLYNQSVAYARYIDITVPLRSCTFTNKELVSTTLTITQSGSDEHLFFILGGSATISVFLADSTYTVIHSPISPDKEDGVLWQPKDYTFTCSLASQSLDLWLDTFDNVPVVFDEIGGNILDWLTNNRWLTIAGLGVMALNFIGLVFVIGVIVIRLPKREEKGFGLE